MKFVFFFGEAPKSDKALLGGKGAGLAEMTKIGLPVPPGFTITTEACIQYQDSKAWPAGLKEEVEACVKKLEERAGKRFGDPKNPLLVSVRSGAKFSMPGMMDTVLNLGLNDTVVEGLAHLTKNERFAYDSFRRFIQMFGDVVLGIKHEHFEAILARHKAAKGTKNDTDLTAEDLKKVVVDYKALVLQEMHHPFPTDHHEQLTLAINAVFGSWNNARAITYRRLNKIPDNLGTAVNVQAMVFGNMGSDSGTGVGFTRDPSTGEKRRYGEYLIDAQGEDVVAGIRTPKTILEMEKELPKTYHELMAVFDTLEKHYHDMQDIEFTFEKGKLYMLQTRSAKRTALAAVRCAIDMVNEGLIDKEEAVMRVDPEHINQLLHKQLDPKAKKTARLIGKGLPASPGAAVGRVVFHPEDAVALQKQKIKSILVRMETSPEDIEGMNSAEGVLTCRGGMTSHAAVVARGMNKTCVSGCGEVLVDEHAKMFTVKDVTVREGDTITLDGSTGEVFLGAIPVVDVDVENAPFKPILAWADTFRRLGIRTNADTPKDSGVARAFGAEGIGLVRTEHMFFDPKRIMAVREMIIADDKAGRLKALAKLLPYQRSDFEGIFTAMHDLPVIIRLLDPPLHEFLPHEEKEQQALANDMGVPLEKVRATVEKLKEANPMLGFRGCRLVLVYDEIAEMQMRAVFEAALECKKKGIVALPEIEVPIVGHVKEFVPLMEMGRRLAKETGAEGQIHYKIGTMIEVPRAALTADELAKVAEFMSFGTNDLTQMGCGFSRDDAGRFLGPYVEMGIYKRSPFETIDQEGVGKLMEMCVKLARGVKPDIDIGICGEHGGDPDSIDFCHRIGLSNVSCSPWRVPVARLAAAQAAIREKRSKA